jgi:hypothetical protein
MVLPKPGAEATITPAAITPPLVDPPLRRAIASASPLLGWRALAALASRPGQPRPPMHLVRPAGLATIAP